MTPLRQTWIQDGRQSLHIWASLTVLGSFIEKYKLCDVRIRSKRPIDHPGPVVPESIVPNVFSALLSKTFFFSAW